MWHLLAALSSGALGCDNVTGGAVELSWKLRPAASNLNDKFVDCDSGKDGTEAVAKIRLHWKVDDGGPDPGHEGSEAWECRFNRAVTGFELAPGTAQLWITPECENGPADPDTYIAPAIIERNVALGDTVSLGAVELVVATTYCRDDKNGTRIPLEAGVPDPYQPCICDTAQHPGS
jgi:hypothetical protein